MKFMLILLLTGLTPKEKNITIIQCYAPTNAAKEEETKDFYNHLQALVDSIPKRDLKIIMGDLNAKVRNDNTDKGHIMGKMGVGNCNENASFINLINGNNKNDCLLMCNEAAESAIQKSFSQSVVCRYAQNSLDCFKNTCGLEVSSHIAEVEEMLRDKGFSCDLSGSSTLSGSLLIVVVALLFTGYRA